SNQLSYSHRVMAPKNGYLTSFLFQSAIEQHFSQSITTLMAGMVSSAREPRTNRSHLHTASSG
ncbi:MAG TPA: hypothetical protein DEF45_11085, partial [Rhodopirellula sp.]|nr:hypothetical protein [Rhodopirellula sp.]